MPGANSAWPQEPPAARWARVAIPLAINGLVLGWAVHAGWTLFSVFFFYWMETVALLAGTLAATALGTLPPDRDGAGRAAALVGIAALAGFAAVHGAFVVLVLGSLTYGGPARAWAEALALAPLLMVLLAFQGLALPAVDRYRQSRGRPQRLVGPVSAARTLKLHLGLMVVAPLALALEAAGTTALVVAVMLAKMGGDVWRMRTE